MKWHPLTHPEYNIYIQHMLLVHTCMHMAICKSVLQEAAMQACKLWLMTAMAALDPK